MIDFLYSNKMQFIIHLILSIYILLYYGMDIFEKFYRKKYNNDKYETNVKSNKIIGYYYLIVETFFNNKYSKYKLRLHNYSYNKFNSNNNINNAN